MKLEGIMRSEIKSDKERQILYDLIYMWNIKTKKETNKQTQAHRYRQQTGGCQRWMVGVGG